MSRIGGKTILVTGADGGIGSALTHSLYADGAQLVLHGGDVERLQALTADCDPARVILSAHDITDVASVDAAVFTAIERFGHIDILINLAGINRFGGILQCSEADWDSVLATNIKGYFLTTRAVMPVMKEAGQGLVLNISSVWGVRGNARMMAYSTSKHAVQGFTASLRAEATSWGIKVASLVIGIVDTPFRDAMRNHLTFTPDQCESMLQPDDVVSAIQYMITTTRQALPSQLTLEAWLVQ